MNDLIHVIKFVVNLFQFYEIQGDENGFGSMRLRALEISPSTSCKSLSNQPPLLLKPNEVIIDNASLMREPTKRNNIYY